MDNTVNNLRCTEEAVQGAFGGKILESLTDQNVHIMNNHRHAYSCWKTHFNPSKHTTILMLHIDAHPDAISSDFSRDAIPFGAVSSDRLKAFSDRELKWDNFLHPFVFEYRDKIHLLNLCHESEISNGFDPECETDISFEYTSDKDTFFSQLEKRRYDALVLDIDLDYFTIEQHGDDPIERWKDEEVRAFMASLVSKFKTKPDIVTIATSPWCLGSFDVSDEVLLTRANDLLKLVKEFLI